MSLKTKSIKVARLRSSSLAAKLEEDWMTLRWKSGTDPFQRFLKQQQSLVIAQSNAPLLSESNALYYKAKSTGRTKAFKQSLDRAVKYLTDLCGDKPIDTYTRSEANSLRDALVERGLSRATVKRLISTIRAIINFTTKEIGLDEIRTFAGIFLSDDIKRDPKKRQPVPQETIKKVQSQCQTLNDQPRWLIALVSDTGMRLSEAVGLVKDDICLEDSHPHIKLKEHPWRRLKTRSSTRTVPLAGNALWAAKRAVETSTSEFLFPKYCNETKANGNSASAALNKWLRPRVPKGCVVHSLRHSMRDRLRAVECPPDIIDRIGGWTVDGVGETYGEGYPVNVLHKWISLAVES